MPGSNTYQLVDTIARVPISQIVLFGSALTAVRLALYPYLKKTPPHMRTGFFPVARFVNDIADALIYAAIVVFLLVRPFGVQTFFIPSESMVSTLRVGDLIVANKFIYRTSDPKVGDVVVFKPPHIAKRADQPDSDFIKRCMGVPGDVVEMRSSRIFINGQEVKEPFRTISDPSNAQGYPYRTPAPESEWDSIIQGSILDFKLVEWSKPLPGVAKNEQAGVLPVVYREGQIFTVNSQNSRFPLDESESGLAMNLPPTKIPDGYYLMIGDNRNGSDDRRFWGLVPRANIVGRAADVCWPIPARGLKNPIK